MVPFKVLSHVSVTVTDLEKAKAFYEGVLGLRQIPRPDFGFPGVWYNLGGDLQLHIMVNEKLTRPPVERESFEVCYPHFALWTEDADATARKLAESAVHFYDFTSTPTGFRQLFVKDPDGNMIEFIGPTKASRTRRTE
ncbi:MAG: VOC family protein [Candidatus Rokubacteria bacterium]|nr:VOC family protein [Candidatus Rokubacteria bacterium]